MGAKRVLVRAHGRARTHTHRSLPLCCTCAYTPTPSSPYQLSVRILGEHTLPLAPTLTRARTGAHIEDPSREAGSERRSAHGTRSLTCRFPASFSCRFSSCSNKPDYRRTARLLQRSRQLQTGRHRVFYSGDCGFYP